MIPESRITKAFVSLAGEDKLFSMAQSNVTDTLKDIQQIGPYAFIASNGMNQNGSATRGSERHYWWSGSEIDADYLKDFMAQEMPDLERLEQSLGAQKDFQQFAQYVSQASEGHIQIDTMAEFATVKFGKEEKQVVRLGITATAENEEQFACGLEKLQAAEQPERKTDYASMIIPAETYDKFTFKD